MELQGYYSTWTEIDLGAIENNVRFFVEHSGAKIMAVVKANGYGHGAIPAAQAALRGGAAWCAVARVEEATELREAGIECPVLIMGLTPTNCVEAMISSQVSMTVWQPDQVVTAGEAASITGTPARLHLKVDTGMSRLGVSPEGVVGMARRMADTPGVVFEGMFTHFARADELEPGPTDEQEVVFQQVLEQLDDVGLRPPLVHAANSATTLTRPNDHFDAVRTGIAIYGLHPSHECLVPEEFQPALTWKTQLSQVKMLPPGRGLSYGHIYTTSRNELIGTLPVGYADGFRRTTGNQALVGGKRVPVVGRVCMDQCLVQLDAVPDAGPGDEVVLIGSQGEESIRAEEVADRWGTINYEVTCGIGARVPRLYSGEISIG
jgi:alanine racemase